MRKSIGAMHFHRRPIHWFLFLLLSCTLGSASAQSSGNGQQLRLQYPAVRFTATHGFLLAHGGVRGTSVFRYDAETQELQLLDERGDIPSLHAIPLPEGRLLLANPRGTLDLAMLGADGALKVLRSWPAEGSPTHLLYDGKRLVVAAGAGGVLFYDWSGEDRPPHLRGRYVFNDYAKKLVRLDGHLLAVADNFDTGLLILDDTDNTRPRRVSQTHLSGFVDDATAIEGAVFATSRKAGVFMLQDIGKNPLPPTGTIPVSHIGRDMARVVDRWDRNQLLVMESGVGIRRYLLQLPEGEPPSVKELRGFPMEEGTSAALAVLDGAVYVGAADGTVHRWIPETP